MLRLLGSRDFERGHADRCVPLRRCNTLNRSHGIRFGNGIELRVAFSVRLETLTIHHGRHTFISHALAGGRTLAEVRDAVGHANVSITSAYLHIAVEDDEVGTLFKM